MTTKQKVVGGIISAAAITATVLMMNTTAPMVNMLEMPYFAYARLHPEEMPWGDFTHMIMFFYSPTSSSPYTTAVQGSADSILCTTGTGPYGNGENKYYAANKSITNMKLMRDSSAAHGVKLLLGIRAETGSPASTFAAIIADTVKQDIFIAQTVAFAKRNGFAGADFNWEYPTNSPTGRANFNRFLAQFRAAWPDGILSLTLANWYWWSYTGNMNGSNPQVEVTALNTYVNFLNLEMYGMEQGGSYTFNSPLHLPYPNYAVDNGSSRSVWDFHGPKEWIKAGVNPKIITTMLPWESKQMGYTSGGVIGGSAPSPNYAGNFTDFQDIYNAIKANPSGYHWDDVAKVPWYGGFSPAANANRFYSFEDSLSLWYKVQYARDLGLAGVSAWDLYRATMYSYPLGQRLPQSRWQAQAVGNAGVYIPPPDTLPPPIDTTHPPVIRTASIVASPSLVTKGQTVTVKGTTSEVPAIFDIWLDGKYYSWLSSVTIDTLSVGTHTFSGYVKWSDGTWSQQIPGVSVTVSAVAIPPTSCNYDSVKNLWYAIGVTDGKRSVVCPVGWTKAQVDSASISGYNSAIDAMPNSVSGNVTLTVTKPAKK